VVFTGLAKDPKERFATIEQFAHALHTAVLEPPRSSPKPLLTQSPPEPRGQRVLQPVPFPPVGPPLPALQPGTSAEAFFPSHHVHTSVSASYDWLDPAQIAINRRGQFTPEQQAILDKEAKSERTVFRGWIITLFISTPLAAFLLAVVVSLTTSESSPFHLFCWMLPVLSFGLYVPILRLSRSGEARLRERIAGRQINRDDGLIVWKGGYVVQLSSGQLRRNLSPCGLLPGPYRCYHLAKESILLSAEPISDPARVVSYLSMISGATHQEQAIQLHQKAFCDLFGFRFDDLISNRQGTLSEQQIQELAKERATISGSGIGVSFMIGAGTIAIGIVSSSLGFLVIGAGVTLAAVVAAFFIPVFVRKYAIGLRKKRVEQIEGRILKRVKVTESAPAKQNQRQTFLASIFQDDQTSQPTYSYFYDIGGLSFPVPDKAHEALFPSIRYRLFYLPKRSRVLSIEPLEAPGR